MARLLNLLLPAAVLLLALLALRSLRRRRGCAGCPWADGCHHPCRKKDDPHA